MTFLSMDSLRVPPAPAAATPDDHNSIRTVGRLVLFCALVLVVSAGLLVGTALQVMRSIDQADLDAERQRAANALDRMTDDLGPLTPSGAELLGQLAGLRNAHLAPAMSTDSAEQQIPLLGRGPAGSYLVWTRTSMAEQVFRQFAPIRLPIIAIMLLLVFGVLMRLRAIIVDIEWRRRLAHQQSRSDVVTGLANRLAFETALDELAGGPTPFAIILFDLDRFKTVNDAFGHAAGDDVLRAVGARLSRLLQAGDLLARLGGDEFVMLCTSRADAPALRILAQQCIAAIEQPIQLEGRALRVGTSLGIVPAAALHLPPATLMGAADAALYRAKAVPGSASRFAGEEHPTERAPGPQLLATA